MPHDSKRKRWSACGVCTACLATDCGDCINCMDKSKFGGQGVRKQSCVMRRCVRMTSQGSSSSTYIGSSTTSRIGSCDGLADMDTGSFKGDSHKPDEQALFWAAVSGCMALNGQQTGGSDDDASTINPPHGSVYGRDSGSSSPRSPAHSWHSDGEYIAGSKREREYAMNDSSRPRPSWTGAGGLPSGAFTGKDSFCCKLAALLALDKRFVAQPIALRALRRAGVIDANAPSGLASSLSNPALVSHLTWCLAVTAGVSADELAAASADKIVAATPKHEQRARGTPMYEHTSGHSTSGLAQCDTPGSNYSVPGSNYSVNLISGLHLPRAEPRVAEPRGSGSSFTEKRSIDASETSTHALNAVPQLLSLSVQAEHTLASGGSCASSLVGAMPRVAVKGLER